MLFLGLDVILSSFHSLYLDRGRLVLTTSLRPSHVELTPVPSLAALSNNPVVLRPVAFIYALAVWDLPFAPSAGHLDLPNMGIYGPPPKWWSTFLFSVGFSQYE